jgi:hypothetical protein
MRLSAALKWTTFVSFVAMVALSVVAMLAPFLVGGLDALSAGAGIVMWFSLLALGCATTLEQGRCMALMWSGIVASALSAAGWLAFRFQGGALTGPAAHLWVASLMPTTCWAGLCVVVGLAMQQRQTTAVGLWLRRATIAGAVLLAASIPPVVWLDLWRPADEAIKFLGALSVLVALGLVATMIVARLRQLEGIEDHELVRLDFTATCPRCELRQPMVTGGDVCSRCGLQVKVIVP